MAIIREQINVGFESHVTNTALGQLTSSNDAPTAPAFHTWTWGGRLHMVPETFEFPKTTVKSLWDLWFFGSKDTHIQPYKHLNGHDLKTESQKQALTRARKVIDVLQRTAVAMGLPGASVELSRKTFTESDEIYNQVMMRLLQEHFPRRVESRFDQMQYFTFYDCIKKKKKL